MRLRTSKILKFFAILLFSFEMFAPALVVTVADDNTPPAEDCVMLTDNDGITGFMSSLLFEENSGEEEERESKDHKAAFCLTDFGFVHTFVELTTTTDRQVEWHTYDERPVSQPAVFTLLHSYII